MKSRGKQCYFPSILVAFCCHLAAAELVQKPKDTESKVGASTFLNCSTSNIAEEIFWFHYQVGSKDRKLVYGYNQFYSPYKGRFELEKRSYAGQSAYNLVISSVISQDSGIFECQDGAGHGEQSPQVQLIVLDADPCCHLVMRPEGFIGPNSCGLEPEDIHFKCQVKFHGNQPPMLALFQGDSNQPITEHVTHTVSGDLAVYNLTIKTSSSIDGSHFECKTTRSSAAQYQCLSKDIKVVGSARKPSAAIIILGLVIPLAFIGGWFGFWAVSKRRMQKTKGKADEAVPLDELSTETPEKNPIYEKLITENEQLGKEKDRLERLIYLKQKSVYSENPRFIQTINTKAKSIVSGITLLRNQLYIIHEHCPSIEVYDSMTFNFEKVLSAVILNNPLDITSSEESKCLSIVDSPSNDVEIYENIISKTTTGPLVINKRDEDFEELSVSEINEHEYVNQCDTAKHQLRGGKEKDANQSGVSDTATMVEVQKEKSECLIKVFNDQGDHKKKWAVEDNECRLSSNGFNVIVCLSNKRQIIEYSPDGTEIRRVRLSPSNGFDKLFHAIKVTGSDFIVSHTVPRSSAHRLSLVDADGKVKLEVTELKFFKGSSMSDPKCLIEDQNKSVLVADTNNRRILLLNSTLNESTELITYKFLGIDKKSLLEDLPERIVLDEPNGRLFIALKPKGKNVWETGRISVINVL